jgi:hypothetical protein
LDELEVDLGSLEPQENDPSNDEHENGDDASPEHRASPNESRRNNESNFRSETGRVIDSDSDESYSSLETDDELDEVSPCSISLLPPPHPEETCPKGTAG